MLSGGWGVGEEKGRKGSEGFVRLSKLCFTKLPQCLSGFSPIHAFDKMAVMNYGGWEGIIWYFTSNCIDFMLQLCFERELFFFGREMLKQFSFAVCSDCFFLELVTLAGVSQMSRGNLSLQDLSPPLLKHLELFQNILDSASTFGEITIIKVGAYLQRVSLENPTAKKTEEVIFREEVEEEVG